MEYLTSLRDMICEMIPKALEAGVTIAEVPLTAFLTPEVGPLAPVVAMGILWVAQHAAGGLADWVCDKTGYREKLASEAAEHAAEGYPASRGYRATDARDATTKKVQGAMREFSSGNMQPPAIPAVPRPQILMEHLGARLPEPSSQPIYPIVASPTITGFVPHPVEKPSLYFVETHPKSTREIQWERYQGTYNGQPNATYPKVGF